MVRARDSFVVAEDCHLYIARRTERSLFPIGGEVGLIVERVELRPTDALERDIQRLRFSGDEVLHGVGKREFHIATLERVRPSRLDVKRRSIVEYEGQVSAYVRRLP